MLFPLKPNCGDWMPRGSGAGIVTTGSLVRSSCFSPVTGRVLWQDCEGVSAGNAVHRRQSDSVLPAPGEEAALLPPAGAGESRVGVASGARQSGSLARPGSRGRGGI